MWALSPFVERINRLFLQPLTVTDIKMNTIPIRSKSFCGWPARHRTARPKQSFVFIISTCHVKMGRIAALGTYCRESGNLGEPEPAGMAQYWWQPIGKWWWSGPFCLASFQLSDRTKALLIALLPVYKCRSEICLPTVSYSQHQLLFLFRTGCRNRGLLFVLE